MKKIISILLLMAVLVSMSACNSQMDMHTSTTDAKGTDPLTMEHTHNWTSATCTAPKTCKTCGATEGVAKGHKWNNATCTASKTCKICGATEGAAKDHKWNDATCTAPKTCKTCGETEGVVNHEWLSATCTDPLMCKNCGETVAMPNGHKWESATCTAPKTCKSCGATEGAAKGHDWVSATCTEPKTCEICGATEGTAKNHNWNDATCTAPKTCKTCGATEGSAKGHVFEWSSCIYCSMTKTSKMKLNGQMHQQAMVYDGVRFEWDFQRGLPESVEIYTVDQKYIKTVDFGIVTPSSNRYIETSYVDLPAGDYIVVYTYYRSYTHIVSGGRYVCRGTGSPTVVGAVLFVK